MLQCVTNSRVLKSSLEFVSIDDYDNIVKNEFKNMCTRFNLNESQMIALVTTLDTTLLNDHYETIWDGLNYYSMACMDDYKTAYIESLYKTDLTDARIELLCDDLQKYIKCNTCINTDDHMCNTFSKACYYSHDCCIKYLLNNPQKHCPTNEYDFHYFETCDHIIDYLCRIDCPLNVIKYAFETQNRDCTPMAIFWACRHGNLNVTKYLLEVQKKSCTTDAIDYACMNGHLDVIKYLFEVRDEKCSEEALYGAIRNGHLDVVKYLFEIQKKDCVNDAINNACMNGHLNIVAYLFEKQNKDCTTVAINSACIYGHLDVVKYLFEKQHKDCTTFAVDSAIKNGHLDIVAYLFEKQNKNCSSDAISFACYYGYLDIVKYLFEKRRKKCSNMAIRYACDKSHFDIVKYLIKVQHKKITDKSIEITRDDKIKKYLLKIKHDQMEKSPNNSETTEYFTKIRNKDIKKFTTHSKFDLGFRK